MKKKRQIWIISKKYLLTFHRHRFLYLWPFRTYHKIFNSGQLWNIWFTYHPFAEFFNPISESYCLIREGSMDTRLPNSNTRLTCDNKLLKSNSNSKPLTWHVKVRYLSEGDRAFEPHILSYFCWFDMLKMFNI